MAPGVAARAVQERPAALDAYLKVDFSPNGDAYARLLGDADAAAQQAISGEGNVHLTPLTGETPAFLTPAMQRWYERVNGDRRPALAAVKSLFGDERMERGARGQLFEAEMDKAQDEYLVLKRKFVEHHRADKKALYQQLDQLQENEQNARSAYEQMRAELGDREPKVLNRPLYIAGLLGITAAESLLNYESFAALKWTSPAIALGMTLLVAAAIAFSSHCHGTLLKQWEYYFGPHREDISRGRALRLFGLGTTAFTLGLAAVYYARDTYLADLIDVRTTIGGEADTNPLWIIGGSLLGNVIVYVVGVMIAYFMHDSNPDYPEKKNELDKLETERQGLQNTLSQQRQREFQRLGAILDKNRARIKNVEEQQRRSPNYARNRQWFSELQRQDSVVQAALQDYRDHFVGSLTRRGAAAFFYKNEEVEDVAIPPATYQGLPVRMKYGHF